MSFLTEVTSKYKISATTVEIKFGRLPKEIKEDILSYFQNIGAKFDAKKTTFHKGTILASDTDTLKHLFKTKVAQEGKLTDLNLIKTIGKDKRILEPILIDEGADTVVEGRHRLAAALKYKLDVPYISFVYDAEDDDVAYKQKDEIKIAFDNDNDQEKGLEILKSNNIRTSGEDSNEGYFYCFFSLDDQKKAIQLLDENKIGYKTSISDY